ncbi:MAG: DUF3365 domain-containing protein [bacterium]|nr:DUF3365 domain-containing protein [bacterium]
MKHTAFARGSVLLTLAAMLSSSCVVANVETQSASPGQGAGPDVSSADVELARLLVKLELRTRGVIAGHYGGADLAHKAWLAENLLLPAAVADQVFHEVVPAATGGRAWVKMVVDEPRNPHNRADATATAMLAEIKKGRPETSRRTDEAYYYAEPIAAKKGCLLCHGQPKDGPDPFFPQYHKNGWQEGEIVGAVVARVTPAGTAKTGG